jgi:hypothetical protein
VTLRVRYVPMPDRVAGVFQVWLVDGNWLIGWIRCSGDGRWVARIRGGDGDPIAGFLRRRDTAMYLACCGWCQPKLRRGAL